MNLSRHKNFLLVSFLSFALNVLLMNVDTVIIQNQNSRYLRIIMSAISFSGILIYPLIKKSEIFYNFAVFFLASSQCFLVGMLDFISFGSHNAYYLGITQILLVIIILNPNILTIYYSMAAGVIPYLIIINYYYFNTPHTLAITSGLSIFGGLYAYVVSKIYELQGSIIQKSDEKTYILESLNEAFASVDSHNKVIYINSNARKIARLLKYNTKNIESKTIEEVFPDLIGSDLYNRIVDCIKNGTPQIYNQYFPILDKHFAIRINRHKNLVSIYMLDITEIELKLKESENQLTLKNTVIKKTIHDIKSPLQAIDFNAHFLEKINQTLKSEKAKSYIERIKESSNLINLLTKDVDSPNINETGSTPINKVFYQIFDTVKNNKVSFTYNELPNVSVNGSYSNVYKAISNITNNAIKYSIEAFIQFYFQQINQTLIIKISNRTNLASIDDTVFEEFHRLTNVRDAEGSGLGLSIAKDNIEKIKGRIRYELNEDEISFIIELTIVNI